KGCRERGLIHNRSPRGVDQKRRAARTFQLLLSNQMTRLICQGDMERDKIRGGKQLRKRNRLGVKTLFFFGKKRLAARVDDRHSKPRRTARYGPPDPAHPHDSQCAAMYLGT